MDSTQRAIAKQRRHQTLSILATRIAQIQSSPTMAPYTRSARSRVRSRRTPAKKASKTKTVARAPQWMYTFPLSDRDVVEASPTSLATCRQCHVHIRQGELRVERQEWNRVRRRHDKYYFHATCLPQDNPQALIEHQARIRNEQASRQAILHQRRELWEQLRRLRYAFAQRMDVSAFLIFDNKVLDELVIYLPTNKRQMIQVKGFKEKRYRSFGDPILTVIQQYLRRQERRSEVVDTSTAPLVSTTSILGTNSSSPSAASSTSLMSPGTIVAKAESPTRRVRQVAPLVSPSPSPRVQENENNDDTGDILEMTSLTAEEIVKRKFQDAQDKGYMITLD